MNTDQVYDFVVVGGGPAGQKAAIHAAKAGRRVLLVERDAVGGECVRHGTIPSKTMREAAMALDNFRRRTAGLFTVPQTPDMQLQVLLQRLSQVVPAHERYMDLQLRRNGVESWHGWARFQDPHEIVVQDLHGKERRARGATLVIATGSRPRSPKEYPVDHEHILDSDSILSLRYLPCSLLVLGGGIIASEYASIFAALGVQVTMIDRADRPLSFLDRELTERFLATFLERGGRFFGRRTARTLRFDGVSQVVAETDDGQVLRAEKALVALGRQAELSSLSIESAGLVVSSRGFLAVDEHCRTAVPHIYAVGDVIGPPALASSAMEQGRRAVSHALGVDPGCAAELIPMGIYTVPEMSSVGQTEAEARERLRAAPLVGRASFQELARGQIAGCTDGFLKLVADPRGDKLLGVQIIGEGAAELIHVGQMALLGNFGVDVFIDNIFNFPTLAEAYRTAALDIAARRGG